MTKQWDEITIAELLEASRKERAKCLELAEQALLRKDKLSCKALEDRSGKHGGLYHAIMPLVDEIGKPESVTVRALLDAIERDRLICVELEQKAYDTDSHIVTKRAFRRQGNHYASLYQDIMYFVNKICPAK